MLEEQGAPMAGESCACHAPFATTDALPTRIDPGLETTVGPPVGGRFAAVAIAVSVLPLVVSAIALVVKVGSDYAAGSDIGLTELRTLDVGRHPVLLGPYSRDGWNHPGPALFYALALPYRLAGSHSVGLAVGALLVNALAIAGIALVARRVAGLPFMLLTLVGCGVLMRSLGPVFLRNPWNPYIAVLPFGLLVYLTWAMTCGKAWALPIGVGVASFCVQTHVGYAPLAAPLLAWGTASLVVRAVRARRDADDERKRRHRALIRAGVVAVAVLIVMWLPAIIQQIVDSPGNLTEVVRYFKDPNGATHSLAQGYRVMSGQFELTPQWLTGHLDVIPFSGEPYLLYSASLPLLLVPLAIALSAFWRWRYSKANRLGAVLLVALIVGLFSVARIVGPAYAYRLQWTWFLGTLAFIIVLWATWTLIARYTRASDPGQRVLLAVTLSVLVVLSGINTVSATRPGPPQDDVSSALNKIGPGIEAALPKTRGDVLVLSTPAAYGYQPGVVRYLERRGVQVRVDRSLEDEYGTHRVHQLDAPLRGAMTIAADEDFDERITSPHLHLVAYWGTRTPDERKSILMRRAESQAAHEAGTLSLTARLHKQAALPLGAAVGVFMTR
jgi:hypothetical protein